MREPRKQTGIYVPPPQERIRPLDERIARVRGRVPTYDFLDAQPILDPRAIERQRAAEKDAADWERRRQEDIAFLSGDVDDYSIRFYIQEQPHRCCGTWHEAYVDEEGNTYPSGWSNAPWYEGPEVYEPIIQRIRQHIIDTFREYLKDAVCPHGEPWEVWEPRHKWDPHPGAGCERCRVEHELRGRGYKQDLAAFFAQDAKNVKTGNTRSANTVLAMLGHSLWAGVNREECSGGNDPNKLTLIEGASQPGMKSKPTGNGPDSYDRRGDDLSAGSQISSREPNYLGERQPSDDERKLPMLPAFDSTAVAEEIEPGVEVIETEEIETEEQITDPENYEPREDPDLQPDIEKDN